MTSKLTESAVEAFRRLLTEGVKVSRRQDGNERGELAWLISFANRFTVIENHQNKRPDLVPFVNFGFIAGKVQQ